MAFSTSDAAFRLLVGNSSVFLKQINVAKRAAENDLPVLIVGETGTGKDLVARAIHCAGCRKNKPYIAENCSAVPETLVEGIFFGTERGAFTEAVKRAGLFEQAEGGTLFLDELNAMPVYLQAKLLRALQERVLRRVGGTKDIAFDVRIIAAMNETPESLMSEGRLRPDLYYRLGAIRIDLPPLREHLEDVPLYVAHFLNIANEKYQKQAIGFDQVSMEKLMRMEYPGNVRQLQNIVESSVAMSQGERIISLDMPY